MKLETKNFLNMESDSKIKVKKGTYGNMSIEKFYYKKWKIKKRLRLKSKKENRKNSKSKKIQTPQKQCSLKMVNILNLMIMVYLHTKKMENLFQRKQEKNAFSHKKKEEKDLLVVITNNNRKRKRNNLKNKNKEIKVKNLNKLI